MIRRCLATVFRVVLAVSGALAQEKKTVPPSPKPEDEEPSLAVTMKFIQDKLNDVVPANYVVYTHDDIKGADWANQFKSEVTKVVANPTQCSINYHWKIERDGKVIEDDDAWFSLKDIEDSVAMSLEQEFKELATAAGHPSWSARIDPPVFVLKVRRTNKRVNDFDFFDEQLTNRVAKAMVHAVELCGGGSKPEPFLGVLAAVNI